MQAQRVQQVWSWCRAGGAALGRSGTSHLRLLLWRTWRLWRPGRQWASSLLERMLQVLALATLMFIALQLAHLSQSLATIAQAQAISGFAVMRSLQAHAPRPESTGAPPPGALTPVSAIDPRRLEPSPLREHGR
jgi:hypothetical protein